MTDYSRFEDDIIVNSYHAQSPNRNGDVPLSINDSTIPNEDGENIDLRNHFDGRLDVIFSDGDRRIDVNQFWEMNYHEASIFLEEGENNEKFDSHPHEPEALPAYLLVHNDWYYGMDLATSLVLIVLAFAEYPATPPFKMPIALHSIIELFALAVIGLGLALKLRWMGWLTILKHKRTMLKCITLTIMIVEAFVVLIRQTSHFRVSRALRPIFLVDTHYLGGVRRFIRQILQSLPPIFDMLLLIFFFVTVYSVLGYYLFKSTTDVHNHFDTLFNSFVNMFVLLTTANFPDIMMPAYSKSKWYSLFFISYLCIVLYLLMNLMLAVVYETFTSIERDKFRKLLLHKRQACKNAFKLLLTKENPNQMEFAQFEGVMRYYAPKKGNRDLLVMFRYLNTSGTGSLTIEEFYGIYDAVMMTWQPQALDTPWYFTASPTVQRICQTANSIISWPYFDHIFYVLTTLNGIAMIERGMQSYPSLQTSVLAFSAGWDTCFFLACFTLEVALKTLGMGLERYFSSGWNLYDFVVTFGGLIAVISLRLFPDFVYVVVFRPLKLLRLFKLKKRYRDIIGTMAILSPLIKSAGCVMLVMYYFFAIIGMELFAGYDMRNCCNGTNIETYYKYTPDKSGYYYLNTFPNLAVSLVTLFELTVVNNWFVVMNGYATKVHAASRAYFVLFYLFTMVVLTIVVASVLEAFRFRIQYKKQTTKRDEEKLLHEEIELKWEDVMNYVKDFQALQKYRSDMFVGVGKISFLGSRPRNRQVLQRRMYRHEIEQWMQEAAAIDKRL